MNVTVLRCDLKRKQRLKKMIPLIVPVNSYPHTFFPDRKEQNWMK